MLFLQFVIVFIAILAVYASAEEVMAEEIQVAEAVERDEIMEQILANALTVQPAEWADQQETHLRKEVSTEAVLPGYFFLYNFGSDNTCLDANFKSATIRRLNNCYYGVKYTAFVVTGGYGLNVYNYANTACTAPASPTPNTFYFPKNTCSSGAKFLTNKNLPASFPSFVKGIQYAYYRKNSVCTAATDGKTNAESIDIFNKNFCFAGKGVDVKFTGCDATKTNAQIYGSISGQCSGSTSVSQVYNNAPTCRQTDIYGNITPRFTIQKCLLLP